MLVVLSSLVFVSERNSNPTISCKFHVGALPKKYHSAWQDFHSHHHLQTQADETAYDLVHFGCSFASLWFL